MNLNVFETVYILTTLLKNPDFVFFRQIVKLRSFSENRTTYITSSVVTTHIERTKDNKPLLAAGAQVLGSGRYRRLAANDKEGLGRVRLVQTHAPVARRRDAGSVALTRPPGALGPGRVHYTVPYPGKTG